MINCQNYFGKSHKLLRAPLKVRKLQAFSDAEGVWHDMSARLIAEAAFDDDELTAPGKVSPELKWQTIIPWTALAASLFGGILLVPSG